MKNCLSIEIYRKTIIFYSFSNGALPYASDRAYFAKNAARFGGRLALYNNTNSRFSFTIYGGEKEPLSNELYKWENYKDNSRHYRGSFIIREDDVFNESYLYDFEIRTNVKTK